jgi:ankyrin repeat protein
MLLAVAFACSDPHHEFVQALKARDQERVRALVESTSVDLNVPDEGSGFTMLQYAASDGQLESVKALLAHGAQVNKHGGPFYTTPLIEAAMHSHTEVARVLLAVPAIELEATDRDGYTALAAAANEGSADITTMLLERGANVDVVVKRYETTPIMEACETGHDDVVRILLAHGARLDPVDPLGRTVAQRSPGCPLSTSP